MAKGRGSARLQNPVVMAIQLLKHAKSASFDKARVLAAVLAYKDELAAAAADPASYEGIPSNQRDLLKIQVMNALELAAARAHLDAGDAAKAMASLEAYRNAGGQTGSNYQYMLAAIRESTGAVKDAYEGYLTAAVDGFEDSAARAKALYVKINGKPDGFEAALAAQIKALPFHPGPFAPRIGGGWSLPSHRLECPPASRRTSADGFVETFRRIRRRLAITCRPQARPMMNRRRKRAGSITASIALTVTTTASRAVPEAGTGHVG
jgi:hypothetical protein